MHDGHKKQRNVLGYKDHAKVDADSKIITGYSTSHDSQEFIVLLDESDNMIYADSAYSGEPIPKQLPASMENQIHKKGYRNCPLNENQKAENNKKSKIRVPIEHVFGFMTGSMHGITLRSIGIHRANFNIGLTNLVYNLCRYEIILQKNRELASLIWSN